MSKSKSFIIFVEFMIVVFGFAFSKNICDFISFPYDKELILFFTLGALGFLLKDVGLMVKDLSKIESRNEDLLIDNKIQSKLNSVSSNIEKISTDMRGIQSSLNTVNLRIDGINEKVTEITYKFELLQIAKSEREQFKRRLLEIMEENSQDISMIKNPGVKRFHVSSNIVLIDFLTKIAKWNFKEISIEHVKAELYACLERIYSDCGNFIQNSNFNKDFKERVEKDADKFIQKIQIIIESPRNSKYIKYTEKAAAFLCYFNDRIFDSVEKLDLE